MKCWIFFSAPGMALAEWFPGFDKEALTLKILLAQLKNRIVIRSEYIFIMAKPSDYVSKLLDILLQN